MDNKEIARFFWEIADILDLKKENPFRIRAYRKAAQTIESLPENLETIIKTEKPTELPGIGSDLAQKIKEILETGELKFLKKIKKDVPAGLLKIMEIPGVGPRHTMLLYETLGITSIAQLKKAAAAGKIRNLPGLGEKTEQNILEGIQQKEKFSQRFTLDVAYFTAQVIMAELIQNAAIEKIMPAGSLRRMQETIGDIDILVISQKPAEVIGVFTGLKGIKKILAAGPTKASLLLENGLQVDLRVVAPASFGAALHYFTGSKLHNIKIRQFAQKKGYKINEYGVFTIKNNKKIAGRTEEEIFKLLGLQFIPPEMREETGEFELALKHQLPRLVELADINGDLHLHTTASDGAMSLEQLVTQARKLNYLYLAVSDHSQSAAYAGGLEKERLLKQIEQIQKINQKLKNFYVLCGSEVDIKPDGSLDYPDEILKKLEIVNASIHSSFKMPRDQMTRRIIKALENPYVTIFSHPTGRLLGMREGYQVDIESVVEAAARTRTILEVNAHPRRLDLTDHACRQAAEKGALVAISTDSHLLEQLEYLVFGVAVARRGWLEAKNVVNTYPLEKLLKTVKIKREEKK
jgi:DNA polymerase (family 10)